MAISLLNSRPVYSGPGSGGRNGGLAMEFRYRTGRRISIRFHIWQNRPSRLGRWLVQNDKDAPSGGQVLAQLDVDNTSYRFPVAVTNEPVLRDLQISVRCKAVTGT